MGLFIGVKMAQLRFNTAKEISFTDLTEYVNIIPEAGVTFDVSYWSGTEWIADDKSPMSSPQRIAVQSTRTQIVPTGGFVGVFGKGDF